jgi:hypothetical protein
MADELVVLRNFRDNVLSTNVLGRILVEFYYNVSPPMADFIAKHESLRSVVRWGLLPLVGVSWLALKIGPEATLVLLLSFMAPISVASLVFYRKIGLHSKKREGE